MKKYEWEYMVTSIVVNKADEIAQVLYECYDKIEWLDFDELK